jgi:hypothetical protein
MIKRIFSDRMEGVGWGDLAYFYLQFKYKVTFTGADIAPDIAPFR